MVQAPGKSTIKLGRSLEGVRKVQEIAMCSFHVILLSPTCIYVFYCELLKMSCKINRF